MEFLVQMDIRFGNENPEFIRALLESEALAAKPYLESGEFTRAWRSWGTHEGDHGHVALWTAPSYLWVRDRYDSFPLVRGGYTSLPQITELMHNPNDPGPHPLHMADAPFPLTFENLRAYLIRYGTRSGVTNEGLTAELVTGVTIHNHPRSGRASEIHFMVFGQKVAEIGPLVASEGDEVAPRYIDLLVEWDGKPVHHEMWKNRILADNGLLFNDYESAKAAPRTRHVLASNP